MAVPPPNDSLPGACPDRTIQAFRERPDVIITHSLAQADRAEMFSIVGEDTAAPGAAPDGSIPCEQEAVNKIMGKGVGAAALPITTCCPEPTISA